MSLHLFGIRHHGSGCAKSLKQALTSLQPDLILIEGPPEADGILSLAHEPQMKPPVAILIYAPTANKRAEVYYPFAVFSPEWQGIQYGLNHQIPIRFMDLPQSVQMGLKLQQEEQEHEATTPSETNVNLPEITTETVKQKLPLIEQDPLFWLAKSAGYDDSERWWEHLVEQRQNSTDLFQAILEAMSALRSEMEAERATTVKEESWLKDQRLREARREAYMRKTIREAQKEGFQKIAVISGAWHSPALTEPFPTVKEDNELLKGLPKVKVEATWIPWSYGRLSYDSGYGAGIESPGWYDHLWTHQEQIVIHWLTLVAQLLRERDFDASSASVIEAVRLAETLAALRDRPVPSLSELNEAVLTVFCFGDRTPMQLIEKELIISDRLGEVPEETPLVPLQQDLQKLQKSLRLKPEPTAKKLELDLRKNNDLERSYLLHRLNLLDIPWGNLTYSRGKGTFKEAWSLQWQPEFALNLIEMAIWGSTVYEASVAYSCNLAKKAENLPKLTKLLDQVLLANLPETITYLMDRLQAEAAIATDIGHLMEALPSLVNMARYRDVRQTDRKIVNHVIDGLVVRICLGLPLACASLNEEASQQYYDHIQNMNNSIKLLQNQEQLEQWYEVLTKMITQTGLNGLLQGQSCRIMFDSGRLQIEETAIKMGLALSIVNELTEASAWLEGFLKGSGLLLLHNEELWQVLDQWIMSLNEENFINILPLLRRTFATFPTSERRQMGEKVKSGNSHHLSLIKTVNTDHFEQKRAKQVLPLLAQLLQV
jgi:hypothetical protein